MSCYTQLTREERYQISVLKRAGLSQEAISGLLKRSPATISRELRRNRGQRGYRPQQANERALKRRREKVRARIPCWVGRMVDALLTRNWSPEQISGRLKRELGVSVSHEWIYRRVYADKAAGGDLHTHLRCRKQRRKRYGVYSRRGRLEGQVSIEQRPAVVDEKSRLGDWEGDTVIGRNHCGALGTVVERVSCFTVICALPGKKASTARHGLAKQLRPLRQRVLTLTLDNGKEWAEHIGLASDLDADIYFAHPYASWERGLNENTNGLIRQYFPKTMDLTGVTEEETRWVANRLNHRPRKKLDYRTPHEVFYKTTTWQTLALTS